MKLMFVRFRRMVLPTVLIVSLFFLFSNLIVPFMSNKYCYDSVEKVPVSRVAVVLGTSKYLSNGYLNYYFKYRVDAVVKLYNSGKISKVLISGDNSRKSYNEPEDFRSELIAKGVPADKIVLDFAGFRTLDSMVRAHKVFGLSEFVVVSQEFHNQRAVFLARCKGINAIAYNAKDVSVYYGLKTKIRESLARCKALLDILIGTKPKFLGEKVYC